jgi:hypothetical protein
MLRLKSALSSKESKSETKEILKNDFQIDVNTQQRSFSETNLKTRYAKETEIKLNNNSPVSTTDADFLFPEIIKFFFS